MLSAETFHHSEYDARILLLHLIEQVGGKGEHISGQQCNGDDPAGAAASFTDITDKAITPFDTYTGLLNCQHANGRRLHAAPRPLETGSITGPPHGLQAAAYRLLRQGRRIRRTGKIS